MCTLERRGKIYILTLIGEDDHRLNPTLIGSIRSALAKIRSDTDSHQSCALITTAHGKFFSNGYDLALGRTSPSTIPQMSSGLRGIVTDLINLPMPTIAAISGHASAGGFFLALSHDYIIMRKDRGFIYLSELDIGLKISAWILALIRCKIGDPRARRELVLRASKVTAERGVEMGIVDVACDGVEETVKEAVKLGEDLAGRGWIGKAYSENRVELLQEVLDRMGFDEADRKSVV